MIYTGHLLYAVFDFSVCVSSNMIFGTQSNSVFGGNCENEDRNTFHSVQLVQAFKSRVLHYLARRPLVSTSNVRNAFNNSPMPEIPKVNNHTHGQSAAVRSSASNFAVSLADSLGMEAYFIQCSHSDVRNGWNGFRTYYWPKDMATAPSDFQPPMNALLVLVDVDYYVDMHALLLQLHRPVLIYTLMLQDVSATRDEYSYTFNSDNELEYTVSGGASYKHKLWNYGGDSLLVSKLTWKNMLCFWRYSAASYLVDRRTTAQDHGLVLFSPICSWVGFAGYMTSMLSRTPLRRLSVVEGDFLRLDIVTARGHYRSTGRAGAYNCATITVKDDSTLASMARLNKTDISVMTTIPFVGEDRAAATALAEYHRAKTDRKPDSVVLTERAVHSYQFATAFSYDPTEKPSMVAFMSPLIDACFVPTVCKNNEIAAITNRITNIKTEIPCTSFLTRVIKEFIDCFMPSKYLLHPVTIDEVYERQTRPSQRRILDEAVGYGGVKRMVKSFIKKESYSEVKDPRVISTINGRDKLEYSRYIYALADYLGDQPWYAFSKPPVEIAQRVTNICSAASVVTNTDMSRFDGRVSGVLRLLEQQILVAAFHLSETDNILELHRTQFCLKGVSPFGVKYETGYSRASGSPETSCFNSIANAFIAFLGFRKTKSALGNFYDPIEAYQRLGIYGGDDGLTADIDPISYEHAGSSVGQVLKVELIKRGDFGVQFLARIYSPGVWFGNPTSCCDLPRQLSKFHATVKMSSLITPQIKLRAKALSFWLTDANTPIIGHYVGTVLDVLHRQSVHPPHEQLFDEEVLKCVSWFSRYDKAVQYPNENDGWMDDYLSMALPGFDLQRFSDYLGRMDTIEQALAPPLCLEIKAPNLPRDPVVVDGEIPHRPRVPIPKVVAVAGPRSKVTARSLRGDPRRPQSSDSAIPLPAPRPVPHVSKVPSFPSKAPPPHATNPDAAADTRTSQKPPPTRAQYVPPHRRDNSYQDCTTYRGNTNWTRGRAKQVSSFAPRPWRGRK